MACVLHIMHALWLWSTTFAVHCLAHRVWVVTLIPTFLILCPTQYGHWPNFCCTLIVLHINSDFDTQFHFSSKLGFSTFTLEPDLHPDLIDLHTNFYCFTHKLLLLYAQTLLTWQPHSVSEILIVRVLWVYIQTPIVFTAKSQIILFRNSDFITAKPILF